MSLFIIHDYKFSTGDYGLNLLKLRSLLFYKAALLESRGSRLSYFADPPLPPYARTFTPFKA
jgi:hypothetical protein